MQDSLSPAPWVPALFSPLWPDASWWKETRCCTVGPKWTWHTLSMPDQLWLTTERRGRAERPPIVHQESWESHAVERLTFPTCNLLCNSETFLRRTRALFTPTYGHVPRCCVTTNPMRGNRHICYTNPSFATALHMLFFYQKPPSGRTRLCVHFYSSACGVSLDLCVFGRSFRMQCCTWATTQNGQWRCSQQLLLQTSVAFHMLHISERVLLWPGFVLSYQTSCVILSLR